MVGRLDGLIGLNYSVTNLKVPIIFIQRRETLIEIFLHTSTSTMFA